MPIIYLTIKYINKRRNKRKDEDQEQQVMKNKQEQEDIMTDNDNEKTKEGVPNTTKTAPADRAPVRCVF